MAICFIFSLIFCFGFLSTTVPVGSNRSRNPSSHYIHINWTMLPTSCSGRGCFAIGLRDNSASKPNNINSKRYIIDSSYLCAVFTYLLNLSQSTSCFHIFNSLRPSDAYMRQLTKHHILQGSFRLCNWLSLRRLVSWINHLPPACWSIFWKSIFKNQLGCRFDILECISSFFCILTYANKCLDAPYHFWRYLYFLNILYFFKYSCTNIFHRRSLCTFYWFR